MDVVIHIFRAEVRSFYGLERLWGDAPRITVSTDLETGDIIRGNDAGVALKEVDDIEREV